MKFDAKGEFIRQWNTFFLLCSVVALTLDPLFLYVPVVNGTRKCLDMDHNLAIVVCVLRSFADILYVFHIIIQFRTMYAPSYDTHRIRINPTSSNVAKRYLKSYFIIDVFAALPLPQKVHHCAVSCFVIIPNLDGPTPFSKEDLLKFIIFSQYVPRVIQTSLFYWKVTKTSGFCFCIERAWAGAAFNFFMYVLASYVLGALWYLFAIESALRCWHIACKMHNCHSEYLYCGKARVGDFRFLNTSCPLLERNEIKDATNFDFGIFLDALQARILETRDFRQKIMYCSLWGLQNLSSLGQGLKVSTFYGEILFAYIIVVTGLVLYVWLFGNMQKYLQSPSNRSRRMEEMKEKQREADAFMSKMSFPVELSQRVSREHQNSWKIEGSVDLKSLTRDLSPDLRKDINRHFLFPLLKRVPTFERLDEHLLDVICDCLKPVRYTETSYLVREGAPARSMLFITRGTVFADGADGVTTGDFYGEELLKCAFDPKRQMRPFSTRTVIALTDVQAYSLEVDELLQVVTQFRRFYDRFYSQQWRTQAACNIQFAWRSRCKRRHDVLATGSKTSTLSFGAYFHVIFQFYSVLCVSRRKSQSRIHNGQVSTTKPERMPQKLTQANYDEDVGAPKLEHILPINVCF